MRAKYSSHVTGGVGGSREGGEEGGDGPGGAERAMIPAAAMAHTGTAGWCGMADGADLSSLLGMHPLTGAGRGRAAREVTTQPEGSAAAAPCGVGCGADG